MTLGVIWLTLRSAPNHVSSEGASESWQGWYLGACSDEGAAEDGALALVLWQRCEEPQRGSFRRSWGIETF